MTDQEYYDEKDSELDLIKEQAFQTGYEKAMHDVHCLRWNESFSKANEDPTGQDLDDFVDKALRLERWDDYDCPIQQDELRRGA